MNSASVAQPPRPPDSTVERVGASTVTAAAISLCLDPRGTQEFFVLEVLPSLFPRCLSKSSEAVNEAVSGTVVESWDSRSRGNQAFLSGGSAGTNCRLGSLTVSFLSVDNEGRFSHLNDPALWAWPQLQHFGGIFTPSLIFSAHSIFPLRL